MTNPGAAIKMLITYAICIPLAIFVGYLLTNPLDYGTLGFLGLVIAFIISPIFIKWHYPIMVFGLGCPAYVFFLKGNPPLWQVVTILSLGIAIVERAMSSERRFLSVPIITRPLFFLLAVVIMTAELTGGIGMHTLGGAVGGGQKYMWVFCGIGMYFALSSRQIPREKRKLYLALFYLSCAPAFISDLFPVLPSPLNYINLVFPPSEATPDLGASVTVMRLVAFAIAAGGLTSYMLARYGLGGIFLGPAWRAPAFIFAFVLSMVGGFRSWFINSLCILAMLFFVEKLYRTRLLLVGILAIILSAALLVPFADKLPNSFQRCLTFLPLNLNPTVIAEAQGSSDWRHELWADVWPQVPGYLLLGKGYALSAQDFETIDKGGLFHNGSLSSGMDKSQQILALSGDYHNGPLSILMPFGLWGALGFLWLEIAAVYVLYRNYKYGEEELRTVNALLMVSATYLCFSYITIFGAFATDVGLFSKWVGFSVALNGGLCGPKREPAPAVRIKPLARPVAA